jgi:hypothetical protein
VFDIGRCQMWSVYGLIDGHGVPPVSGSSAAV